MNCSTGSLAKYGPQYRIQENFYTLWLKKIVIINYDTLKNQVIFSDIVTIALDPHPS